MKVSLPSSILPIWLPHLNLLCLTSLTLLDERYNLWRSLWSLLHSHGISLGPKYELIILLVINILPSSILATCPDHLNLLDLITLTILGERKNRYIEWNCEGSQRLKSGERSILVDARVQEFSRSSHEYGCYIEVDGFKRINSISHSFVIRSSGSWTCTLSCVKSV